jgi:hypothetical protein
MIKYVLDKTIEILEEQNNKQKLFIGIIGDSGRYFKTVSTDINKTKLKIDLLYTLMDKITEDRWNPSEYYIVIYDMTKDIKCFQHIKFV